MGFHHAQKNFADNVTAAYAHVKILSDDFDAGNYHGLGQAAAALCKLGLPLETAEEVGMVGDKDCGDFTLNTTIIADYLAGFMHGFTGHDDKAEMEACFADDDAF